MNGLTNFRWFGQVAAVALIAFAAAACGSDDDTLKDVTGGELAVAPNPVIFSEVDLGDRDTIEVTLSNLSTSGSLRIDGVRLIEDTLDDNGGEELLRGDQWFSAAELGPGESRVLSVQYAPGDDSTDSGRIELDVIGDDNITGVFTIDIQTAGLQPDISTPSVVRFSRVAPVTTETFDRAYRTQEVQNIGAAPLSIESVILTGSSAFTARFFEENPGMDDAAQGSETWPAELEPGGSFWYRVYFNPEDPRPSTASLSFFTNDPDSDIFVVEIEGNSDSPCLEFSNEEEINFGQGGIGYANTRTVTARNCGQSAELVISGIEVTDTGDDVFSLREDSLPEEIRNGDPLTLEAGERINFVVTYTPIDESQSRGQLTILSNDNSKSRLEVPIIGRGTDNVCPTAIAQGSVGGGPPSDELATDPQARVQLDATQSIDPDGTVDRYEWSIVTRPQGSEGVRLFPGNDVADPYIEVDAAGTYVIELTVFDDGGVASCGDPARVTINAIPSDDIHVQLVWKTPLDQNLADDNGSDLDLHFRHGVFGVWNNPPYDVFWDNTQPDWGDPGPSGDARLDLDDTNGAGPENVNMALPEADVQYGLGVYYYDSSQFGESYATIRVYLRQQLAFEYRDVALVKTGEFWDVGLISWRSQTVSVRNVITTGFP